MGKIGISSILFGWVLLSATSCQTGHCRHYDDSRHVMPIHGSSSAAPASSGLITSDSSHVLIFKSDASVQCQPSSGITPEQMENAELRGILIHRRLKSGDGKMRMTLCGQPTGQINVFEISKDQLIEAENRNFKVLEQN